MSNRSQPNQFDRTRGLWGRVSPAGSSLRQMWGSVALLIAIASITAAYGQMGGRVGPAAVPRGSTGSEKPEAPKRAVIPTTKVVVAQPTPKAAPADTGRKGAPKGGPPKIAKATPTKRPHEEEAPSAPVVTLPPPPEPAQPAPAVEIALEELRRLDQRLPRGAAAISLQDVPLSKAFATRDPLAAPTSN